MFSMRSNWLSSALSTNASSTQVVDDHAPGMFGVPLCSGWLQQPFLLP